MQQRMVRRSPVRFHYYTREDIEKRGIRDLYSLIRQEDWPSIDPSCPVLINGGPRIEPLWKVMTEEIEYVELILGQVLNQRKSTVSGSDDVTYRTSGNMSTGETGPCGNLIIAWLRR